MEPQQDRKSWWRQHRTTFFVLLFLVLLAGALRTAFNYEPAVNDGVYRYAGNDDYYHLHVVQEVQASGDHVVRDPLLNYPLPYRNPRPPLYDWHVAIGGQVLGFLSGEAAPGEAALDSGKYALEWGSAFWGALTVIPVWLLGRATFGNKTGLWAGFLIAASPAHIQRSGFGLGDHDAFIVFFLVLGIYFLVRALQLTRDDNRVDRWTSVQSIANGFGTYITTHREGLVYAFLAGVSWAAIGLAWEGFPYAIAIYAVYYVFQLIANQIRRRDSTGDALVFSIIMATILAVVLPYYWVHGNIGGTLNSATYVIAILALLSLALIPTRDLPAILVLPGLALVGLVLALVLFVILPDVGSLLLSANGYFNQSKLYSTIAEAQRTELGVFVFSVGFMTFFFALIGFVMAIRRYFKLQERAMLFLVAWGLLSIYMGFAATRFIFNAAPVFAILGGWVVVRLVEWMNFKERVKSFQSLRQDSFFKATRSTLGAKQIAGSLFLLLTLIVPNLWFSIDAGIPSEARLNYRQNHPGAEDLISNRTGAFGQGFLGDDWQVVYGWLDQQDREIENPADRPAHMAWWDYGFWEVALAHHPTVSDNFQNGHQLAGRFLAAQSEKEGIDWFSVRLLEGDFVRSDPDGFTAPVVAELMERDSAWPERVSNAMRLPSEEKYGAVYNILQERLNTLDLTVQFYEDLQSATGKSIQYFLVDNRMLPYDDESTAGIESGSILYAPVFLANKNPDDFIQTVYVDVNQNQYFVKAYTTENGVVVQESPTKIVDQGGRCYFVSGGQLWRADEDCKQIDYTFNGGTGLGLQSTKLVFKDTYYRTMFYRGFVGGDRPAVGQYPNEAFIGDGTAGAGLTHFRLVNGTQAVKLLQYYPGAVVTGTASAGGASLAGFEAVAVDPFGIGHGKATIGDDGKFTVIAPFNLPGESPVRIEIRQGSDIIGGANVSISKAAAFRDADYNFTVDVSVEPGSLSGFVFADIDRSGGDYNASVDKPLEGATVQVDGRNVTTGADGRFDAGSVLPGRKTVTATAPGYDQGSATTQIPQGGSANVTIRMRPAAVPINGTLRDPDGVGIPTLRVNLTALNPSVDRTSNTTATTNADGNFSARANPGGDYRVWVDWVVEEDNASVRYKGETTVNVPLGSPPILLDETDLVLTRTEE